VAVNAAQQATEAFSGAEYLEVKVWQSMFDGADSSVLKLFMGVRGLGVARVTGCADEEVARWLEQRMMQPVEVESEKEGCVCGHCGRVCGGKEWFRWRERDAWRFGNR
jgi:hypothetical protein